MRLLPHHRQILEALEGAGTLDGHKLYLSFKGIAYRCEIKNFREIRRIVRHLARRGLAEYGKGLWDDEGMPKGSGYAITEAGEKALEAA